MNRYLKLAERPVWVIAYPQCSACEVDLETDGDGWDCPSCGTTWSMHANDGDEGELSDDITGPVVQNKDAWRFSGDALPVDERDERIRGFYAKEGESGVR